MLHNVVRVGQTSSTFSQPGSTLREIYQQIREVTNGVLHVLILRSCRTSHVVELGAMLCLDHARVQQEFAKRDFEGTGQGDKAIRMGH
jgi:soluble P-type ATPase